MYIYIYIYILHIFVYAAAAAGAPCSLSAPPSAMIVVIHSFSALHRTEVRSEDGRDPHELRSQLHQCSNLSASEQIVMIVVIH